MSARFRMFVCCANNICSQSVTTEEQVGWIEENERRNATTAADIQRKQVMTETEAQAMLAKTQADILATDLKTAAEIQRPKPAPTSK